MYELKKYYHNDEALRRSFNELAQKTFGLDFEDWYQNGYWSKKYTPYSIVIDGRVVANVSVNNTDFILNGSRKHLIQLGTVMTEEKYRNKGYIRRLMEEITKDYEGKTDGIYLFANDSVLDFYPKFGFQKISEYQYSKPVVVESERSMVQIPMYDKRAWTILEKAILRSDRKKKTAGETVCSFEMVDNPELILFYVTKFMQENVYYDETLDVFAIAQIDGDTLFLYNVFSAGGISLDSVVKAFGREIKKVILKFKPDVSQVQGYTISRLQEEDCTLFVQGNVFRNFEQEWTMFPSLSHA